MLNKLPVVLLIHVPIKFNHILDNLLKLLKQTKSFVSTPSQLPTDSNNEYCSQSTETVLARGLAFTTIDIQEEGITELLKAPCQYYLMLILEDSDKIHSLDQ